MPTTLYPHTDTWVDQQVPDANQGQGVRLQLRSGATSHERRTLIFFPAPFPAGVGDVYVSAATLSLYARDAWGAGTRTLTVRRITDEWKENQVTFSNKPASSATHAAAELVGALVDGDLVEIDVTAMMQDAADGDPWQGFEIRLDEDVAQALYSSDAPQARFHPRFDITWSRAPYPPSHLSPAGGRAVSINAPTLSWRFTDPKSNARQSSMQVQISASADFTSPLYDSGKVAHTPHQWNLAGETTIAAADVRYWRVRVWDQADVPSGWSDTVQFTRTDKGTLTILNPAPDPDNVVDETTPPIIADLAGATVRRAKVVLDVVKANGDYREIWEAAEQAVDAISFTVPQDLIVSGKTFRARVYAWDDVDREGTPGDPTFYYAEQDFTYVRDGTPAPVATLVAAANADGGPGVVLTWTRSTAPDYFSLRVDGEEVHQRIYPVDVEVSAGHYAMTWWRALPNVAHTFEVEAVVIGAAKKKHSSGNPTVSFTTKVKGKWLVDEDNDIAVQILGAQQADISIGESGTTFYLIGNRVPVRITDSVRGYEGSASGTIPLAKRQAFIDMKGDLKALRYAQSTLNFPIRLAETPVAPDSSRMGNYYSVGITFFQVGEFDFDVAGE